MARIGVLILATLVVLHVEGAVGLRRPRECTSCKHENEPGPPGPPGPCPNRPLEGNMLVNDDGTCGVSSLIVTDPSTVRIGATDVVTSILGPNVLVPGLDLVPQNGTANISAVAIDSNTGRLFKGPTLSTLSCSCSQTVPPTWQEVHQNQTLHLSDADHALHPIPGLLLNSNAPGQLRDCNGELGLPQYGYPAGGRGCIHADCAGQQCCNNPETIPRNSPNTAGRVRCGPDVNPSSASLRAAYLARPIRYCCPTYHCDSRPNSVTLGILCIKNGGNLGSFYVESSGEIELDPAFANDSNAGAQIAIHGYINGEEILPYRLYEIVGGNPATSAIEFDFTQVALANLSQNATANALGVPEIYAIEIDAQYVGPPLGKTAAPVRVGAGSVQDPADATLIVQATLDQGPGSNYTLPPVECNCISNLFEVASEDAEASPQP